MRITIASLVAVTLAGAGCGVQRPSAALTEARVDRATEEGVRVLVHVALRNPNDTPLPIHETRYEVTVNGEEFRFTDRTGATMPAKGQQVLSLPAAVRVPAAHIGGADYRVRGVVTYEPPGEIRGVLTDTGVPLPSVAFSGSGTLAAPAPTAP